MGSPERHRCSCAVSREQDSVTMAKKKGFMTPERKKKLRTLLRKKAAEELKKEQERKAEERLRVIAERCGTKADIENASVDDLKKICQQYFDKWYKLEAEMFFLQREVILRDLQINELTISVSDMKGKFIKPSLKKVSKYENKFAQLNDIPGQHRKHLNYNNTYSANKHIPSIRVVLFNKGSLTPPWTDQCRLLVQHHLIKILNCLKM